MDQVMIWWKEIDPLEKLEVPLEKVTNLLVTKGITSDLDSAQKILIKYIGKENVKSGILTS